MELGWEVWRRESSVLAEVQLACGCGGCGFACILLTVLTA